MLPFFHPIFCITIFQETKSSHSQINVTYIPCINPHQLLKGYADLLGALRGVWCAGGVKIHFPWGIMIPMVYIYIFAFGRSSICSYFCPYSISV